MENWRFAVSYRYLRKVLAFRSQCAGGKSRNSYNSSLRTKRRAMQVAPLNYNWNMPSAIIRTLSAFFVLVSLSVLDEFARFDGCG